jgi:hypothetical protein
MPKVRPEMEKAGGNQQPTAIWPGAEGLNDPISPRIVSVFETPWINRFVIDQLLICSACP